MHVLLDLYVSLKPEAIKILKLCVFLIVIFLLGLLHLDFNQVSWHEETVYPLYHPLVHSQYASHDHASVRGMVLVALTAEYQECLKVGPFDMRY